MGLNVLIFKTPAVKVALVGHTAVNSDLDVVFQERRRIATVNLSENARKWQSQSDFCQYRTPNFQCQCTPKIMI